MTGAGTPGPDGEGDGALVQGISSLRVEALAEVYDRHGGAVFALALRVLGSREAAEEVVQEVFLRLWQAPDRFDAARGTLRSFLLALTHGRAVDLLRSETSRRRREHREERANTNGTYDLEEEVWDLAMAEHVQDALKGLPEDERQAIELAYFGGRTYREVAVQLNQPEGTVKSRIRSGLRRLRATLSSLEIGPP